MQLLRFFTKHIHRLFFGAVAALFVFQVFAFQKPAADEYWKRPLHADAAGYYVYLPAALLYHFDARYFTDKNGADLGNGFDIDRESGKIKTKYSCGVALMQAPFFGIVHLYCLMSGQTADGISLNYDYVPILACAFYLFFGLLLLYGFLRHYFSVPVSLLVILLLLAGTNLLFYLRIYPGMSHVYSFFLVVLILNRFRKNGEVPDKNNLRWCFFLLGLLTLIRPTNLLLAGVLLLLDVTTRTAFVARFRLLTQKTILLPGVVLFLLPFLPQVLYWKYAYGSFLHDTYTDEGFTNWSSPHFGMTWLSPQNGLFSYAPVFALIAVAGAWFVFRKNKMAWWILGLFLIQSYLFASWHVPDFGNGIGNRNFIDLMPVYALLLGMALTPFLHHKKTVYRMLPALLLVPCCLFALRVNGGTDFYFQGKDNWDWTEYKFQFYRKKITSLQDYENVAPDKHRQYVLAASGKFVSEINFDSPRSAYSRIVPVFYGENSFREIWIETKIKVTDTTAIDPYIVCYTDSMGKIINWNALHVKKQLRAVVGWQTVKAHFILDRKNTRTMPIMVNIENPGKNPVLLDDTKITLY